MVLRVEHLVPRESAPGCVRKVAAVKSEPSRTKYWCGETASATTRAMTMAEQPGPQAALIPAQPAVLVVGDRRIPIDDWPLARSVEERRSVELRRPSDDVLVIEPKGRA